MLSVFTSASRIMARLLNARNRRRLRRRLQHQRELSGNTDALDWAEQALDTSDVLVAMLQRIEGACPLCDREERGFHAEGCPLGELLAQVE